MSQPPQIPLCIPCLDGREKDYIVEALDAQWVSYVGPHVDRFERMLESASGAAHAAAVSSGTSALHLALLQAGVGIDDEVAMPAVTFVAPANAVRYCGAWPIFIDIQADDWQLSAAATRDFLVRGCESTPHGLRNRITGRVVKAILLVHLLGGMGDVDAFAALADEFGLFLIEDSAECLGALYKNQPMAAPNRHIAAGRRVVATSFNGNKIITTGGGGALLSHSTELNARARHLSTTAKTDPIEFIHDEVGFNYRLTNIAAALGIAQLERLSDHVRLKRAIADRYNRVLSAIPGVVQVHPEPRHCTSTFWMYTVLLDRPARPVVDALGHAGITSRPLWRPMTSLPAMQRAFSWGHLPQTIRCCTHSISLPCSVNLAETDQMYVVRQLERLLATNAPQR